MKEERCVKERRGGGLGSLEGVVVYAHLVNY